MTKSQTILATAILAQHDTPIIQFLLSGTVVDKKIHDTATSKPFTGNVDTPQRDSLSTVYLEHALKEVRCTLPRPTTSFEAEIPK